MTPNPDTHETTESQRSAPPAGSAWVDPITRKPELTGRYLVWTSKGPDILRVEETFMEYSDESLADWDEILAWAEINQPNTPDQPPP